MAEMRRIEHIFHPTDLSHASGTAFLHALRIAVATRSGLTILHVTDAEKMEWGDLPGVRTTLKRWGYLKSEEDMEALVEMGVGVRKLVIDSDDPVAACLDHLERHPTDLVVLATHQNDGRMGWFRRRVAEPLSREAGEATLFLPHDRSGFVDPDTGEVRIRQVLLPVTKVPDPRVALRAATSMVEQLVEGPVHFTLLHVGNGNSAPALDLPEREAWTWEYQVRSGDVVDTVVAEAGRLKADLVVMTTKGHDGFLDALRGSTTERIMREVKCPVVASVS